MRPGGKRAYEHNPSTVSERLIQGCYVAVLLISLLLLARLGSDLGHLGFAVPRLQLVLCGLAVGMLCAFLVSPESAEAMIFVLRTGVLLFIACGLVAFFTAALVFGVHWPIWGAVPVGLVLGYIALMLLSLGVGGNPHELVEPCCIILLLAHTMLPAFEQAKQRAEHNRNIRQAPGSTAPARPQPQGSIPALRFLISISDTERAAPGFQPRC